MASVETPRPARYHASVLVCITYNRAQAFRFILLYQLKSIYICLSGSVRVACVTPTREKIQHVLLRVHHLYTEGVRATVVGFYVASKMLNGNLVSHQKHVTVSASAACFLNVLADKCVLNRVHRLVLTVLDLCRRPVQFLIRSLCYAKCIGDQVAGWQSCAVAVK